MKTDNEPAISLPVYFKSVKTEDVFFVGVEPRTFFFLEGERLN